MACEGDLKNIMRGTVFLSVPRRMVQHALPSTTCRRDTNEIYIKVLVFGDGAEQELPWDVI
jgi:hypothetical protein